MNFPFRELARRLLFLCFWLSLISLSRPASASPVVATILGVRGASQVRHGSQTLALTTNRSLYVGDLVRVGNGAKLTLLFSDGSQIRLNSNSVVQITAPTPIAGGKRSLFRVIGGEIWARLRPNRGVQTASAVLGVAGTEFDVRVTENQTTLTVLEGVVDFSNALGAVAVGASQQSSATPTTAPTRPVSVAGAGFIVEWTLDLENAVIPREKFFVSLDKTALQAELARRTQKAAQNDSDANAERDLGEVLFDLGRTDEALRHFQKSDALQPSQSETLARLGYVFLETSRPDEAQIAFHRAAQSAPDAGTRAAAWLGLSATNLSRAQFAEAEKNARESLDLSPLSAEANIALGLALSRQPGRENEAKTAFQTALKGQSETVRYQAQSWLALLQIAENNRVGALQNARQAVQNAPDSALAHGNLALIYFFEDQSALAVREAKIAARLNPQSVAARVALGQSLLARGDADGAAREAARAVALDPQLSAAHYLLGVADAQRRDYVHAARDLRESLRLTPHFLPAASALARVYNLMGRPREALALLTDLQAAQRENGAVAAALGEVFYEQANYPQALAQFERAVALEPQSALSYAGLARVALDANRLDEAIAAGQKAVQIAPNIGQYHAVLGLAYTFSHLDVQAEREYRAALSLDPQNALALVQLAFLNEDGDVRTTKRTAGLAFAQGFLYDPAVSRQLLRGGVQNELTPRAGSGNNGVTYTLRDIGDNGNFHFFGRANRQSDDGDRDNSFAREFNARQDSTLVTGRTNWYFHSFHRRDKSGLPGPLSSAVADDRAEFRFDEGILASRTRVGARGQLFAGFFANSQNDARFNPNGDTSSVLNVKSPFNIPIRVTQNDTSSAARDPEVRFDWQTGDDPARPRIFSVGAARLGTRTRDARDLLLPGGLFGAPDNTGILQLRNTARTNLFFAQLSQRASEKLNFSVQLRAQRTRNEGNLRFENLTGNALPATRFSGATSPSRTNFLPALSVSYGADRFTTLRFFASRRATDTTSSILTPADAQLSVEGGVLPSGLPRSSNSAEFDIERQIGGGGLFKLFGFRSSARDLRLDGANFFSTSASGRVITPNSLLLGRVARSGVGARLEKPLARHWFAQAGVVLSRTRVAGGGAAPYQPATIAIAGLNYVDARGNKAAFTLQHAGAFSQISATPGAISSSFGAKTTVDVRLSRESNVRREVFLQVSNLFDAHQIAFEDVPVGARRVQVGFSRRF